MSSVSNNHIKRTLQVVTICQVCLIDLEKVEDTKGVIRSCKLKKDGQCNGQQNI